MNLINRLLLPLLIIGLLGTLGCVYSSDSNEETSGAGIISGEVGDQVLVSGAQTKYLENTGSDAKVQTATVNITSENRTYKAYTAAPTEEGSYPAVVLIHSFRGFEPGYQEMVDRMAAEGYVVIAPFWQTYSQSPSDAEVESLIRNTTAYLEKRGDVDSGKLGLTGFCAGGRYTMLFLPQIREFESGVAWYGFPYTGGSEIQPDRPASLIDQLDAPMLIIHGTQDEISNVTDIYRYAGELDEANKYFELKVYQGEPHGFMITEEGKLSGSFVAKDAYREMMDFFDRTLNSSSQ
jgi:carboxymethylenebutenolidase